MEEGRLGRGRKKRGCEGAGRKEAVKGQEENKDPEGRKWGGRESQGNGKEAGGG